MITKRIAYRDYNDVEREENFYFNLNKAELLEMDLTTAGGFQDMVKNIVDAKDNTRLYHLFKNIVLKAYGEKSADGKHFMKSEEISKQFEQTEAFSNLIVELLGNADTAAKFVSGILPADVAKEAEKEQARLLAAE